MSARELEDEIALFISARKGRKPGVEKQILLDADEDGGGREACSAMSSL